MFALLLLPLLLQRLLPSYSHGGGGSLLGRREGKGGWVSAHMTISEDFCFLKNTFPTHKRYCVRSLSLSLSLPLAESFSLTLSLTHMPALTQTEKTSLKAIQQHELHTHFESYLRAPTCSWALFLSSTERERVCAGI